MPRTRKKPVKTPLDECKDDIKTIARYITQGNNILTIHGEIMKTNGNPAKKLSHITPSLSLLKTLEELTPTIAKHKENFRKDPGAYGTELSTLKNYIEDSEKIVASQRIQLNKITADKYMYLRESVGKISYKKTCLTNAYTSIQTAWALYNQFVGTLLPSDYDPGLEGTFEYIKGQYESLTITVGTSPLHDLLLIARSMKDKENAYAKFQEALQLAKQTGNVEQQFTISYEQARNYLEILFESNNELLDTEKIQQRQAILRKTCDAFIAATQIKLAYEKQNVLMNMNSEGICIDFFRLANHLITLSTTPKIVHNFELRLNLLKDAKEYQKYGNQLSDNLKKNIADFKTLASNIEKEQQSIDAHKLRIEKEKNEKEEKDKLEATYDVTSKIKKFYTKEELQNLENPKTRPANKSGQNQQQQSHSSESNDDDDSSINVPEEEILTPTYITFEWKREKKPYNNLINLAENLTILSIAESKNDLLEQLRIHVNIAEYYRIQAMRSLRRNITYIPLAIGQLEDTKNHLQVAGDIIKILKTQSNAAKNLIEDWVVVLLNETEKLLAKTLKRQTNIEKRLDKNHDEAMNYIISKYGPKGWFKNDKFDWLNLSFNAQIHHITKRNVKRLTQIHQEISQVQIQLATTASSTQSNEQSLTDDERKRIIKLGYAQQNFFSQINKPRRPLVRSQSMSSFFDENEINTRSIKRKNLGR